MKQNLYLVIAILIICFYSCGQSGNASGAKSDSSRNTGDTTGVPKSIHPQAFFEARRPASPNGILTLIDTPVANGYQREYLKHPVIFDISGGKVYGFMLDTATDAYGNNKDFGTLKKLTGIDNIYIKFGIKGSFTGPTGALEYIYTIMVVPIGKDKKPIQNTISFGTQTVTGSDYDVACPCVNGQGCCPN